MTRRILMAAKKRKQADDGLGEYERKRDFGSTPEPAAGKRPREQGAPRFVVQEHSARRLHWDLRLEHEGVAVSWAIPNGIPTDPSENRKAVHTEDHPLEYLEFEGEIPAGEYGAGTMRIWDQGTYEAEKWERGKIVLSFAGEQLRGRYALFRAGEAERDWMIHRIDPPEEEHDPFPEAVVPMLARLAQLPADDDGWAVEVKLDGVRAIAYCRPGRLALQTRNLNDVTRQYPEVRRLSRQLGARDAVLDGELVAFDEEGRPSFERLQQRIHQTSESVVRRRMGTHPVTYVIFDLLYLDGRDLIDEPYTSRRELLEGLELAGESWQTPAYSVGHAKELLAASAERGLEGIVLKRLDSRYAPGKRTGAWLKVKNLGRQEFVIGGWQPGEGRRRNQLGAILLGYFDENGELRYAGKVGTGFSETDLDELRERLRPLARRSNPFAARRGPRDANFVEPRLVVEIEFRELTAEGMVRHGSFKGLREDKPAGAVALEVAEAPPADLPPELAGLTGLPSVSAGLTKTEAADWYKRIADVLLPHLHARHVNWSERYEVCASLSLHEEVERPTAVVLDLVPSAPAGVLDCAEVATWIHGMFEQLGLRAYPKTSGAKGIQLQLPLNTAVTFVETRAFAEAVASTLVSKFPTRVAAPAGRGRRGKVLVDWRGNDRDGTIACVYSLRAARRPKVSTPLEWAELTAAVEDKDASRLVFDPEAVLARVEERGDLFAPVLAERQRLPG